MEQTLNAINFWLIYYIVFTIFMTKMVCRILKYHIFISGALWLKNALPSPDSRTPLFDQIYEGAWTVLYWSTILAGGWYFISFMESLTGIFSEKMMTDFQQPLTESQIRQKGFYQTTMRLVAGFTAYQNFKEYIVYTIMYLFFL